MKFLIPSIRNNGILEQWGLRICSNVVMIKLSLMEDSYKGLLLKPSFHLSVIPTFPSPN